MQDEACQAFLDLAPPDLAGCMMRRKCGTVLFAHVVDRSEVECSPSTAAMVIFVPCGSIVQMEAGMRMLCVSSCSRSLLPYVDQKDVNPSLAFGSFRSCMLANGKRVLQETLFPRLPRSCDFTCPRRTIPHQPELAIVL